MRDIVASSRGTDDISQSEEIGGAMLRLRKFMFERVYLGDAARSEHDRVHRTLQGLFDYYLAEGDDEQAVVDYIAGMTDRYAIATFRSVALPEESRL